MSASPVILFGNKFLSYLLVFIVFVVVAAVAVTVGILIAKKRAAKKELEAMEAASQDEIPFTAEQ